ncbi:MAG: glycosyltransferase, partial [Stellaceae bacterium]
MRVLAVSYILPPMQYPQAIQIGRLLRHLDAEIGAVSGTFGRMGDGVDGYADLDSHLAFRLAVEYRPLLSGLPFRLAQIALPFYGRRPDEFRAWVPRAERAVAEKLRSSGFSPDILVTFGEPMSDHLLGLRLKRRLGVPWVAHFSDPWVDSLYRRAEILANTVNRRLEHAVIASADRIVFTSTETVDLVMRKYPREWRAKTAVVPHSYDAAFYPAAAPRSGPLTARYLGNLFGRRTPMPLFRGLRLLRARNPAVLKDWRFELVGRVPARHLWHPARRGLPDGFLGAVPTVPYTRSLALMAESDLLLVIDAVDDLSVFLPSKLVE